MPERRPEADFAEIAAALGVSVRAVQKRADGNPKKKIAPWPFRDAALPTGNRKRLFPLAMLPALRDEAARKIRQLKHAMGEVE